MPGVVVSVTVVGGGGSGSGDGSLAETLAEEMGLEVVHSQGACAPCRANRDPNLIPFPGCNGNIAAKDPDDAKALALGNLCNCRVRFASEEHHE